MRYGRVLAVALFLALVCTGSASVSADTEAQIQAQIEENNRQIQRIKQEIAALEKDLNATVEQKQTLQNAINALNLNIQKLQKSISLTQTQIKQKDGEIGELAGSISTTESRIQGSQEQIANTLRELQALDTQPFVMMMLSGGTLSSFFDDAASLEAVRTGLQTHVHELSSLKEDLEGDKASAEGKRKELSALNENLGQQKQGLTVTKQSQDQLLKETQNKEAAYQAQLAQKRAEQQAFEAALFELASRLQSADPTHILAARSGVLQWPLEAVFVTQQFGKTSDSGRLYSSGTHDGVDFRAAVGTPVHAALAGVVLEVNQGAVPYCQYGKWVLVKHDNGLTTLYAHLSQISVQKGQSVATGATVGYAGNTGYATGPHLHFTVYVSEALTLKQYTCKSGKVVTVPIAPLNAYLNPLSYLPTL